MHDLAKGVSALIQLPRVGVRVRKACFFVDVMNQMRAVFPRMPSIPDLQRRPDDGHAFIQANQTRRFRNRELMNRTPEVMHLLRCPERAEGNEQHKGNAFCGRPRHDP